jgi:hypothetical protein
MDIDDKKVDAVRRGGCFSPVAGIVGFTDPEESSSSDQLDIILLAISFVVVAVLYAFYS